VSTQPPTPEPRDLISRFRGSYRNYWRLWTATSVPEGTVLQTPAEEKLDESRLPADLRGLLEGYRRDHPDERLVIVKYMRVVNGLPEVVIEDESDLPSDDELLTMSETLTLNTRDHVSVITETFVARRVR
jgi:hypothetical protein